ncbi:MAG: gluconate 2-dehydrogenase subunit 3 family protein [Hyphomonadaceae bacterium]
MKHTLINTLPLSPSVSRRTTLKWFAAVMAAAPLAACGESETGLSWATPRPLEGPGYGTDPDMLDPSYPWPLTLSPEELATTAALVDLILPADGDASAASAVGVPDFINEWVSAPYPGQQADRGLILPGLAWLDSECLARGGQRFAHAAPEAKAAILEDIAWRDRVKPGLEKPAEFFRKVRSLTLGAYFTSAEGWDYLGYLGNTPSTGDYAGPTPEALAHLKGVLDTMGLKMPEGPL